MNALVRAPQFWLATSAIVAGLIAAAVLARGGAAPPWRAIERTILVAVLGARLSFLYEYRTGYFGDPWSVFDLADGGWDAEAGIIAAWLFALASLKNQRGSRAPVFAALTLSSAVWFIGAVAITMGGAEQGLSAVPVSTPAGALASLADFQGKPSIVNLWATWCPPCQRELPLLQRAQHEHPEINFVFVNEGESEERVRAFLAARGFALRNVLLDAKGLAGAEYGAGALPTTLMFDRRGRLVGTHVGELSPGTLSRSLERLRTMEPALNTDSR